MFVENFFFIFDKNQFVIRNKLFRWSAEFFVSLPLNDDVMITFTRAFLSFGTWCGIWVANSLCGWICRETVHSPKSRIGQDICDEDEQMVQ